MFKIWILFTLNKVYLHTVQHLIIKYPQSIQRKVRKFLKEMLYYYGNTVCYESFFQSQRTFFGCNTSLWQLTDVGRVSRCNDGNVGSLIAILICLRLLFLSMLP